jgi:hypothetical protein
LNKFILTACGTFAAFAIAACGSSSPSTAANPAAESSTAPVFTSADGASICNDLNTWWQAANNEDMPRFDPTMEADEQEAQGTQLGDDLSTLDSDLQSENTDALLPGAPGDPGDMQILTQDCQAYGVTLTEPQP